MQTTTTTTTLAARTTGGVALDDARFLALITFRRTGEPVSTPVLFIAEGDGLLVRTAVDAGKIKRIRHTPSVVVAAADSRGRVLGASTPGRARLLEPDAVRPTLERLHAKHRIAGPLFSAVRRIRGQRDVTIEIVLERPTRAA